MTLAMTLGVRRATQMLLLASLAAVAMLIGPGPAISQTAWGAYTDCMTEAAVEASNCYTSADGYWQNKVCDWTWSINKFACYAALLNAIGL